MIDKVRIQALKSIRDLTVYCSKLNLIVGTNSSGKSTFLQALLLDAQNGAEKGGLNGPLISLGDYREVRNYSMPDTNIKIWIWEKENMKPAWVEFKEDAESLCKVTVSGEPDIWDMVSDDDCYEEDESHHIYRESGFQYLSCHRLGPQDIYAKNFGDDDNLGIDGEYTFSYLLRHESNPIDEELVKNKESLTNDLFAQLNYWLKYIVDTNLLLNDIKKTNYLQVRYNNNPANMNSEALYCRPVNVGSGISYLVTILITCLASKKGDIILIENPEIHLHPKAQSRLCEFLYFISRSGRQLFVETHSDHIFNGIRVGIANHTMDERDIQVNFFALDKNFVTQCNPIKFGEFGKVFGTNNNMDINDLFDQFEIDLDRMLGL